MSGPLGPAGPELAGQAADGSAARPGRRYQRTVFAVGATVLAADATSKIIVAATLARPPGIRLLGGLLILQETRNSGAAFSLGPSLTVVYAAIAIAVAVAIARTSRLIASTPWAVVLGLLLGGATGNLTDRLLRAPGPLRGQVVDWIWLPHWPPFNLADSAIVVGAVLMALLVLTGRPFSGNVARQPTAAPGS
jgi:lipoprotein signal peptidase